MVFMKIHNKLAVIIVGLLAAICGLVQCVRVETFGSLYHPIEPIQHGHPVQYIDRPLRKHKDEQNLHKIPGVPGHDYPVYHEVPETSFHCGNVPAVPGMYANVETGCQAYHVCHDGREGHQGASFLCTNGTIFNQKEFTCDWWYNVDCSQAPALYHLNADPEHNPYIPKKKLEPLHDAGNFYGHP